MVRYGSNYTGGRVFPAGGEWKGMCRMGRDARREMRSFRTSIRRERSRNQKTIELTNIKAAELEIDDRMDSVQAALDLMATASYQGCSALMVPKEALPETFFQLRTGFAGEVLQKFSNYRMKLAIIGDFSGYESRSLKDFVYECNKGKQVFFKGTREEAVEALEGSTRN